MRSIICVYEPDEELKTALEQIGEIKTPEELLRIVSEDSINGFRIYFLDTVAFEMAREGDNAKAWVALEKMFREKKYPANILEIYTIIYNSSKEKEALIDLIEQNNAQDEMCSTLIDQAIKVGTLQENNNLISMDAEGLHLCENVQRRDFEQQLCRTPVLAGYLYLNSDPDVEVKLEELFDKAIEKDKADGKFKYSFSGRLEDQIEISKDQAVEFMMENPEAVGQFLFDTL